MFVCVGVAGSATFGGGGPELNVEDGDFDRFLRPIKDCSVGSDGGRGGMKSGWLVCLFGAWTIAGAGLDGEVLDTSVSVQRDPGEAGGATCGGPCCIDNALICTDAGLGGGKAGRTCCVADTLCAGKGYFPDVSLATEATEVAGVCSGEACVTVDDRLCAVELGTDRSDNLRGGPIRSVGLKGIMESGDLGIGGTGGALC